MIYNSGNSAPQQGLVLQLQVKTSRNQQTRAVGNYSALYLADGANIQSTQFELLDYSVWASNPQETIQELVVSCSGPLLFQAVKADNSTIELPVTRMLVLDCELKTFKLINQGQQVVRGNIHYVTPRQGTMSQPPMPT